MLVAKCNRLPELYVLRCHAVTVSVLSSMNSAIDTLPPTAVLKLTGTRFLIMLGYKILECRKITGKFIILMFFSGKKSLSHSLIPGVHHTVQLRHE